MQQGGKARAAHLQDAAQNLALRLHLRAQILELALRLHLLRDVGDAHQPARAARSTSSTGLNSKE